MRILLIESDQVSAQSIELMFKSEHSSVYTTDLGEEGIHLAKDYDYDVIITEINLQDMAGTEVVRGIRGAKITTPIVVVSVIADPETKIRALKLGADDYLTKPFNKDELIARVHAVVRRANGHGQSIIEIGNIAVNLNTKTVQAGGRELHLTGKEYAMFEILALRKGQTVTKEMMLNHLYGGRDEPEPKILDVFICKLRRKLTKLIGQNSYIDTVWGRGYTLREPEQASAAVA